MESIAHSFSETYIFLADIMGQHLIHDVHVLRIISMWSGFMFLLVLKCVFRNLSIGCYICHLRDAISNHILQMSPFF